jgi:RNA polymerase sigma factor for flagellar operon FliA
MEREQSYAEAIDLSPAAIVTRYRRMVEICATKVRLERGLDSDVEEDLVAFGMVGLLEARGRYDPNRGFAFSTYAEHRVRGAIRNGLQSMQRARRAAHFAAAQQQQPVSDDDKWDRILGFYEDVAVGAVVAGATGRLEGDCEPFETPETGALQQEEHHVLREILSTLPARSQELLRLHFVEELSFVEIAKRFGVHKSRISHMYREAREQLASRLRETDSHGA